MTFPSYPAALIGAASALFISACVERLPVVARWSAFEASSPTVHVQPTAEAGVCTCRCEATPVQPEIALLGVCFFGGLIIGFFIGLAIGLCCQSRPQERIAHRQLGGSNVGGKGKGPEARARATRGD